MAGEALTETEPSSGILCRLPGTAAPVSTGRQLSPRSVAPAFAVAPALAGPCFRRANGSIHLVSQDRPTIPTKGFPLRSRATTQDAFCRAFDPPVPSIAFRRRIAQEGYCSCVIERMRSSSRTPFRLLSTATRVSDDDRFLPASAPTMIRLATTHGTDARCVRPTSASQHSRLRAPAPRGFPTRRRARAVRSYGGSAFHDA